jgi:hypothetical protein
MRVFLIALVAGGVWGYRSGGHLRALATVRPHATFLLPAALGVQVALGAKPLSSLAPAGRFAIVVASYALIGVWLVVNARIGPRVLRGALVLLAIGWTMNLAVMVPNGGMPVSPSAMEDIGVPPSSKVDEGYLSKHVKASSSTVLLVFADVIPASGLRSVLSVGDLVMVIGLATAVARGMQAGRPDGGQGPGCSSPLRGVQPRK